MSDTSQGPGWWQASDGKWYPPDAATPAPPAPGGAPGYGAPGYGAPVGMGGGPEQYADWGSRVVATLIDAACVVPLYIVGFILAALTAPALLFLFYALALAVMLYFAYLTGETGQSPGKRVVGIKVISEQTGQPIGGGMGIARYFVHIIDGICLIGYLFPLWDPKRQTFADKALTTVVLPNQPKQAFGPDIFKP